MRRGGSGGRGGQRGAFNRTVVVVHSGLHGAVDPDGSMRRNAGSHGSAGESLRDLTTATAVWIGRVGVAVLSNRRRPDQTGPDVRCGLPPDAGSANDRCT